MSSKSGALIALFVLVSAALLPVCTFDAESTEAFTYKALLDDNATMVYNEVASISTFTDAEKDFSIVLKNNRTFEDIESAQAYGDSAVQNALAAEYYSNPMMTYLWDLPVKGVNVTTEVGMVKVIDMEDGSEIISYFAKSVAFKLQNSSRVQVTEESMKALNQALSQLKVGGTTDADKVRSINSIVAGIAAVEDKDGEISNIYDAAVTKRTSSMGAAMLFTYLCQVNKVHCLTVAGDVVISAIKETKGGWNYVYIDSETGYQWFMVDSHFCSAAGISGQNVSITAGEETYTMMSAHNTDLNLKAQNYLTVPKLAVGQYVPPGGFSFLELYGGQVLMAIIGVVIIAGLYYAVRTGNY